MSQQICRGVSLLAASSRTGQGLLAAMFRPASLAALELPPATSTTHKPAASAQAALIQKHSTWPSSMACMQQQRSMACSAGLGRAPPKVINIEYDPEDLEAFIQVADAIEEAYPTVVVRGNEDSEGRPGSFEVLTEDGISLYSRLASHALPGPQHVLQLIASRAKLAVSGADEGNRPFCG